ncbi:MAG: hypothetical protein M3297_12330 [Thermoproteota archaeon]|nr:hypothetical protein [Thermoproteota archaeon]
MIHASAIVERYTVGQTAALDSPTSKAPLQKRYPGKWISREVEASFAYKKIPSI